MAAIAIVLTAVSYLWLTRRPSAHEAFWGPVLRSSAPAAVCIAPAGAGSADIGDALALAHVASHLARAGRAGLPRAGTDPACGERSQAPAIRIGGFTGQRTAETAETPRFVWERDGPRAWIRDRQEPGRRWTDAEGDGLAIVSRVFEGPSNRPVITLTGVGPAGAQMAAGFVTARARLEDGLRAAPAGWERRNVEIVLRAEAAGESKAPRVLALHVW
jgi:hypothetical protein